MNIAYATDDNYAQHVAVSIYSLAIHTQQDVKVHVYILANQLKQEHRVNIQKTIESFQNVRLSFIDITAIEKMIGIKVNVNSLSISTYARLFLPQLIPDVDKLLYLDCDTVINSDIVELYNEDISSFSLAAVLDTMYPEMKQAIGLQADAPYYNAGVLLINLKRWRDNSYPSMFVDFIHKYKGNVPHLDQGVLNGTLRDIKTLPLKYNVQTPIFAFHQPEDLYRFYSLSNYYSETDITNAKERPAVIHYTSFFLKRPWFHFCLHPYKNLYREYLALTPYKNRCLMKGSESLADKFKSLAFYYLQSLYLKIRKQK